MQPYLRERRKAKSVSIQRGKNKSTDMVQDIYTTERKYKIIYADPPWQFRTYSAKGQGRSAERHYPTMPKTEIQALPVSRICEKDCVLFLWVVFGKAHQNISNNELLRWILD